MNSKKVDILNIFLILLSLYLAFKLPFELFLFSYAVLGPLHYLTEINWLKERKYFIKEKKWVWVFIMLGLILAVPILLKMPVFSKVMEIKIIRSIVEELLGFANHTILIAFFFAIGLVYLKKWQHLLLFLITAIIASSLILKYVPISIILVGGFLPTIIHVYLFTLLFMIFGNLNTKSTAGLISIILLVLCPLLIMASTIEPFDYQVAESTRITYLSSGFQNVSAAIAKFTHSMTEGKFILFSDTGIKIQVFIAFAYTYHYLNWFSKTSIIGWSKNISKPKLFMLLSIWLTALLIYWYDYKTGFVALAFLSYLHVFLEFPLNITSIKGIFSKFK